MFPTGLDPKETVIEVPVLAEILAPAGTVQLYDVAPDTAAIV